MPKIAVIGEGVIDRFIQGDSYHDVIGGSGLNTAVAMRRAGANATWFTRSASDPNGQALTKYAEAEGVALQPPIEGNEPASLVNVTISNNGQPQFEFHLDGSVDWHWQEGELDRLGEGFELIHLSSLSAVLDPGAELILHKIKEIKQQPTSPLISFDPNARPSAAKDENQACLMRTRIEEFVKLVDLVKVSDEDLGWIRPEIPAYELARLWSTAGPKLVIMTCGGEGAVAFSEGIEICTVPAVTVDVLDTLGAGDTFMGWLLYQIANEHNCRIPVDHNSAASLLSTAAKAAAITCSRNGCNPPFNSEIN
ncbi:MAG: carbohydrate kinase [Actinobacteria bacterium]|nr:carbohydrate kinase [Actinomycetota bacterium]